MEHQSPSLTENEQEEKLMIHSLSTRARRYRLVQALCMPLIHINIGMCLSIVSPTVPDMTARFRTDYEHYSQAMMMKSVGLLIGSYIGGIVSDRFRHRINLFFAVTMLIYGSTCAIQPWCPNLVLLGSTYAILGATGGALNVAVSSFLISVWGESASLPIHMVYTGFNMGQTAGPLISGPFISPRNGTIDASCTIPSTRNLTEGILNDTFQLHLPGFHTVDTYNSLNSTVALSSKRIQEGNASPLVFVPYTIVGASCCLVSSIFAIFSLIPTLKQLCPKNSKPRSWKDMFSPGSCASGNMMYASFMLVGLFLAYASLVLTGNSLWTWLYPLATETCSIQMSRSEAILLTTTMYIIGLFSKIIWGCLSHCFTMKTLMATEVFAQFGAYLALAFLGLRSKVMLWTWTNVAYFFASPIFPGIITWADRYIEVTGLVIAITDTGVSAGHFFSSWISGVIYQRKGAQDLFYVIVGCSASLVLVLVVMQVAGAIHGDRYHENQKRTSTTSRNQDQAKESEEVDESSPLIN